MNRKVSFIIPILNSQKTIKSCLYSILSQELPSHWSMEILVVDNGSSDNSTTIVRTSFPSTILLEESRIGAGNARNLGIAKSTGSLIAFVDSDVILSKKWVSTSIEKMISGNYAGGQGETIPIGNRLIDKLRVSLSMDTTFGKHNHLYNIWNSYLTPAINTSACIYHRKWLEAVKGFNPKLTRLEDRDLSTRIFLRGGILCDTQAQAQVQFSGNIIDYFTRFYRSGFNYPKTVMSKIRNHRIEKAKRKNSLRFRFFKNISVLLFIFGQAKGRRKYPTVGKLSIPTSRIIQTLLQEKLKRKISAYVRQIELGEVTLLIHIVKAEIFSLNTEEFNKGHAHLPQWISE
jgi:glycosyltransferase involved in cell wall biosynthesis